MYTIEGGYLITAPVSCVIFAGLALFLATLVLDNIK